MAGILIPTVTEAEWLAARTKGITASEIAIVMGLAPDEWQSAFSLYHQKTGALAPAEDSLELRVGRHFEPLVCELFAERYPGLRVSGDGRTLYAHPDRPWQMATPDRLLSESWFEPVDGPGLIEEVAAVAGVLEAKTSASYDGWGEEGGDDIPVHYRCQALWQMDVMGVSAVSVACLFLHSRKLRVYELTMDDAAGADLKLMREEAEAFLARIARGDEPDVDWRPATADALRRLSDGIEDRDITVGAQMARSYRAAQRRYKEAERRKDLMSNRVLQAIGTGHRALDPDGKPVATRSVYEDRRVSVTLVRERHPAVAAECIVTRDITKLIPARGDKS
jgi:putative phage-type endonuclease